MKIPSVGTEQLHLDGQADMTKLISDFRNFTNGPKILLNTRLKLGGNPNTKCITSPDLYGVTEGTRREIDHLVMRCATFRFAAKHFRDDVCI